MSALNNKPPFAKIYFGILSLVILASLALGIYNYLNPTKIAYVRSQELVYGYKGTQEAKAKFDIKKESLQANIDTLQRAFKKSIDQYNIEYRKLTADEKKQRESLLNQKEQQLLQYKQAVEKKAKEEDDKMMQAVLNQVNSYVEEYGKKHHYDIIFGTTLSGSVLYGKDKLDITDQLLEALNNHYKGAE